MKYNIVTDTSANIPDEIAANLGITVVPLSYNVDGESYECAHTSSFRSEEYYGFMKSGKRITTSQITPQKYVQYFEPLLEQQQDILFVGMSSGISGSFSSAQVARDELAEKYPERKIGLVDSYGASLGEGLLVLKAAQFRDEELDLDEAVRLLTENRKKIYQVFTVDDLMYLRRGGRLSGAVALVGTLLNIKPILKGNEVGKIVVFDKARGRKSTITKLFKKYSALVVSPEKQVVGISHCNCPEDAETLAKLIRESNPPKEIIIAAHEPVTGSYLGPGALALYFEGGEDIRYQ